MSIWCYEDHYAQADSAESAYAKVCVFCHTALIRDDDDERDIVLHHTMNYGLSDRFTTSVGAVLGVCPGCVWWKYGVGANVGGRPATSFELRCARLRALDLADVSIPLADVRAYLMARYESRFDVQPQVFEELVASVFRDHGYLARATAYSGDGGIDIILESPTGQIGVQVKRYRGRIAVYQIRELTGALVIEGHTRGIFVTTSEFQTGAAATARRSGDRGYPIDLVDAPAFFAALRIAQAASTREIVAQKTRGRGRTWDRSLSNRVTQSRRRRTDACIAGPIAKQCRRNRRAEWAAQDGRQMILTPQCRLGIFHLAFRLTIWAGYRGRKWPRSRLCARRSFIKRRE